jgi:hypothetical protein
MEDCGEVDTFSTDLTVQYPFELIPLNTDAAKSAGYNEINSLNAQVWIGIGQEDDYDENFYYTAWSGSIFAGDALPSILVSRRKKDGSLIWAKNCNDYRLDTGDTFLGPKNTVCRTKPTIKDNVIYIGNGQITNIGPQVYAVNKYNGNLIWAIAYDIPENIATALNVPYITKKDNYSRFAGSCVSISDLEIAVVERSVQHKCKKSTKITQVYAGVSSLQNVYNAGLIPGINFTGYPYYTDRGALILIEVINNIPTVVWRRETVAPELKPGDILIKSARGNLKQMQYDPFLPGQDVVLFNTIAVQDTAIVSMGLILDKYFVAQRIEVTEGIPPVDTDVAPFWNDIGKTIRIDANMDILYTLPEALAVLTPGTHYLSAVLDNKTNVENTISEGQFAVFYIKQLGVGGKVLNKYDANGLNYWGNSVWGTGPWIDKYNNMILFSSGQSHDVPISERLFFLDPSRNYRALKIPLVDAISDYVTTQTADNLNALKRQKSVFINKIRTLSLMNDRSPRGLMSYADAVFGISASSGRLLFAVRIIPSDVYSFIGPVMNPEQEIINNDVDGDASSGVFLSKENRILTGTKSGTGLALSFECLTRIVFDHYNLSKTGIKVDNYLYLSPNGSLGGQNFVAAFDGESVYACQVNDGTNPQTDPSVGSRGQPEQLVTEEGIIIPFGISVVTKYDKNIHWNTELQTVAAGSIATKFGHIYVSDLNAGLYVLDNEEGKIEWFFNARTAQYPMFGGTAAPLIDNDQVFWISNYALPGYPLSGGKWGLVFKNNSDIKLEYDYDFLNGKIYSNGTDIVNKWVQIEQTWSVKIQHSNYIAKYCAKLYDNKFKFGSPLKESGTGLYRYISVRFINQNTYKLKYIDISTMNTLVTYMTV